MTTLEAAAALLEVESLLLMARARLLQKDRAGFTEQLLGANQKLGALSSALFNTDREATMELFLAATPDVTIEPPDPKVPS